MAVSRLPLFHKQCGVSSVCVMGDILGGGLFVYLSWCFGFVVVWFFSFAIIEISIRK